MSGPGIVHPVPPEPHNPADTTMIPAGVVTIGVEQRDITVDSLAESFEKLGLREEFLETAPAGFADRGVSLHIFGPDGHEYLRFDCFDEVPHYHYNHKTTDGTFHNHQILFDPIANGDEFNWALNCLRHRLPQMLTEAGGQDIAASVDPVAVDAAISKVEDLVGQRQTASASTAS
jgi:hypothetical protein